MFSFLLCIKFKNKKIFLKNIFLEKKEKITNICENVIKMIKKELIFPQTLENTALPSFIIMIKNYQNDKIVNFCVKST
ncbi:hypothetical protein EN5CB1_09020 [Tepidimicrobium xylanilyticum]|nr:hypothetical protein EN5CB1_09020 [Tepidimicrobium xylanilyticum]